MKEQIKKAMEKIAQWEDVFFVYTLGETFLLLNSEVSCKQVWARTNEGMDCLVWINHIEAICP